MRRLHCLKGFAVLFVVGALFSFASSHDDGHADGRNDGHADRGIALAKTEQGRLALTSTTAARPHLRSLIMVAGHSVCEDCGPDAIHHEHEWYLQPGQKGQAETYLNHIKQGVSMAAEHADALLVFSGAETRAQAGPRSEAQSYWQIADLADWYGYPGVAARAITEEHARDSFENLLFSLCRFHEVTGRYPDSVTVISFATKEARFRDLHRMALKYPADRFSFVGLNPPSPPLQELTEGEAKWSYGPFSRDLYGCQGVLRDKRETRNPFRISIGYGLAAGSCPEMTPLLQWCGPDVFPGSVPW